MAHNENDPKEKAVFDQELSTDDLNAVAGGGKLDDDSGRTSGGCKGYQQRSIYEFSFPNCADDVSDGSSCEHSDACHSNIVIYTGMGGCTFSDCHKAWR